MENGAAKSVAAFTSRSLAEPGAVRRPAGEVAVERLHSAHVNFWYGEKQALKDINLSIPDKQITALIGSVIRSGSAARSQREGGGGGQCP